MSAHFQFWFMGTISKGGDVTNGSNYLLRFGAWDVSIEDKIGKVSSEGFGKEPRLENALQTAVMHDSLFCVTSLPPSTVSTSAYGSLIRHAIVLHNTKCVTSDKFQQVEWYNKRNRKHPQGTVISINEIWHHILKYPEVMNNLNFFIIQTTSLETRTGKSLQNPDNPTNNHLIQSDANITNNPKKWLEARMNWDNIFLLIPIFLKVNLQRTKTCSYTRILEN